MANITIGIGNSNNTVDIKVNGSIQPTVIKAPTTSAAITESTTFSAGANGKVLKSNGTNVYWGDDDNNATPTAITDTQINTICVF